MLHRRSWVVASLLLVVACVPPASAPGGPDAAATPSPPPTSAPTTTASTLSTTAGLSGTEPGPVAIEVVRTVDPAVGHRVDELANFGYGGRPSTSAPGLDGPDLGAEFPALTVRTIDLNWGVDSSAVLVTADGDDEMVDRAAARLAESTPWVLAGPGWVAGLHQGGLSADFEMQALSDTISWIMAPDDACELADRACPFGAEVGFPPPPPTLIVNAATAGPSAPFDIVTIESASNIEADAGFVSWVRDGSAYMAWGDPNDAAAIAELGPAARATAVGCFAFLVDPGETPTAPPSVAARSCNETPNLTTWDIPTGWAVTGLAFTGNFQQDDYGLVVTADLADEQPTAVRIPLNERFFDRGPAAFDGALDALPPIQPDGRRWSEPRRTSTGDLVVVEERADGWYLVDNALTEPNDLLRTSHPILSFAVNAGNRDVVIVIEGPDGPSTWWIHDDEHVQLDGSATSVAWTGHHPVWPSD